MQGLPDGREPGRLFPHYRAQVPHGICPVRLHGKPENMGEPLRVQRAVHLAGICRVLHSLDLPVFCKGKAEIECLQAYSLHRYAHGEKVTKRCAKRNVHQNVMFIFIRDSGHYVSDAMLEFCGVNCVKG